MKLKDLAAIGLSDAADQEARERYARWATSETQIFGSESEARREVPEAFAVLHGPAGKESMRVYPLADGRRVIFRGVQWWAPEPGGVAKVFYIAAG